MDDNNQIIAMAPKVQNVLSKLSKLSPQSQDAALNRWDSFLDGMAAQERLMSERPGA